MELKTLNNLTYQLYKNGKNIPPGLLQYKINEEDIKNLIINKNNCVDYFNNYKLEQHTKEILDILIPDTITGNKHNWSIILVIKSVKDDINICYKGALRNKNTNEIALISSIPITREYEYKTIKSKNTRYKICRCKMIAPLIFWEELQNILLN